jgi:arginine decarboxylase
MGYLDLGGGLAIDYDGSNTNFASSRNYSVAEYCADVIEAVMDIMNSHEITHPTIITESGRALVAYYSVLVFDVLDVAKFEVFDLPETVSSDAPEPIRNLLEVSKILSLKNIQECYNDALYYRDQTREMFRHGDLSLRNRALSEHLFWNIISRIAQEKKKLKFVAPELENIESAIADIYYCNFSIFQSLPDSWAIDQLFPIMPIHRLLEVPSRNAVIADITCDCDGKIENFIDLHDVSKTLPLHSLKNDEDYYIGAFLVGAYQETLGDLHNLFGDTNVVNIRINGDGSFDIRREIVGDSVSDVLSYLEYDQETMRTAFRFKAEKAVKEGLITASERREIMSSFDSGLRGYTYYER